MIVRDRFDQNEVRCVSPPLRDTESVLDRCITTSPARRIALLLLSQDESAKILSANAISPMTDRFGRHRAINHARDLLLAREEALHA